MSESPTVRGFFEQDHDRLDGIFAAFQTHKLSDPDKARDAFYQFKAGLERHIVWEEELLFPLWERKTGMTHSGPTVVMRAEHRQIHQLLDRIQAAAEATSAAGEEAERALVDILTSHNMKEERVLYPAIDQAISDEELAAVFRRLNERPTERTVQG